MEENNGYKLLNPKAKLAMYIKNVMAIVILAAADAVLFFFRKDIEMDIAVWYAITAGVIIISLTLLIWPAVFYKHYRYIVDTEKVDVQRGVLFISRTVVPIERIHQVQVKRGPISNYLGLADVVITTAGGAASIQYLDYDIAQSVADYLKDTVNKIIRDRETE